MSSRGNAVEIFQNGAFFDALLKDIAAARHTVHFETFLWKEGVLGQRMADAFSAKALEGVKVRLVLDAQGTRKMGGKVRDQMRAAGCELAMYHPRTLKNIGVLAERDHRKLCILDGRVAWVGGHCIVDEWLGEAQDRQHVRDLSVRLRGPVVHAVQSVFSENWVEVTGKLFVGEHVFPPPERAGDVEAHVASIKPEGSAPAVKILHHTVICCARKRAVDPESLLHPRARRGRGLRQGGAARRRRAHHGAFDRGLGHARGAARRAPQFPAAARLGRARVRVSTARCCTRR